LNVGALNVGAFYLQHDQLGVAARGHSVEVASIEVVFFRSGRLRDNGRSAKEKRAASEPAAKAGRSRGVSSSRGKQGARGAQRQAPHALRITAPA
jgi:hypothetical protein